MAFDITWKTEGSNQAYKHSCHSPLLGRSCINFYWSVSASDQIFSCIAMVMQRKLNSRKIKHLISCLSLSLTLYKHTALKTIRYLAVLEWGSPEEHRGLFPSYILWQIHSSVITGDLWNPRLLQLYFSPPPQLFWAMTKLWQWWLQRKCSKATCWKCSSLVFCVFLCSHPATCALSFALSQHLCTCSCCYLVHFQNPLMPTGLLG